jgi:hypothetical protein
MSDQDAKSPKRLGADVGETVKLLITADLEEFKGLFAQTNDYLKEQNSLLRSAILIFAGGVPTVTYVFEQRCFLALLAIPVVFYAIYVVYLSNEIVIAKIAAYWYYDVGPRVRETLRVRAPELAESAGLWNWQDFYRDSMRIEHAAMRTLANLIPVVLGSTFNVLYLLLLCRPHLFSFSGGDPKIELLGTFPFLHICIVECIVWLLLAFWITSKMFAVFIGRRVIAGPARKRSPIKSR